MASWNPSCHLGLAPPASPPGLGASEVSVRCLSTQGTLTQHLCSRGEVLRRLTKGSDGNVLADYAT